MSKSRSLPARDRLTGAALRPCAVAASLVVLATATASGQETRGPPAAGPPPVAAAAATPDRKTAYDEFRRLFDAKDFEAAVPAAQAVVAATERAPDATREELQVAVMNLATTQHFAGDYVGAEQSYLRAIESLESEGRLASPRLARAYAGLAGTYYAAKRYDLAVARFERALALTRRAEGLFNVEQLPVIAKYADGLTQVGRLEDALKVQEYGLRIAERQYGPDDPRVAAQLEAIGRWYVRVGAYDAGRQRMREAVQLIEKTKGPKDLALLGPLTAIAESFRRQAIDPPVDGPDASSGRSLFDAPPSEGLMPDSSAMQSGEGQRALDRAIAILSESTEASPSLVADVRLQAGDWYQSRLQHEKALPHYQQAWLAGQLVRQGTRTLAERELGEPVLLFFVRPPSTSRRSASSLEGTVERLATVELTVLPEGRVRSPELVENQATERMGQEALESAKTARYRPRFVDGKPVESPGTRFRVSFRVEAEDEAAPGAAPGDAPAGPAPAAPDAVPAKPG